MDYRLVYVCEHCGDFGFFSCFTVCPICGHKMRQIKRYAFFAYTDKAPFLFASGTNILALCNSIVREEEKHNNQRFTWRVLGPDKDFFKVRRRGSQWKLITHK